MLCCFLMFLNKPFTYLTYAYLINKRCFDLKSSSYYFPMNTKILKDLQVCISVSLSTLFKVAFLSVVYLEIANLVQLGISNRCQISARFQYLIRLPFSCWVGHTIHPSRTVTCNWYQTHTVQKLCLLSSCTTGACHCYIQYIDNSFHYTK